jgi:hypothetical protein
MFDARDCEKERVISPFIADLPKTRASTATGAMPASWRTHAGFGHDGPARCHLEAVDGIDCKTTKRCRSI